MKLVHSLLPALLTLALTGPALAADKPDEQALLKVLASDAGVHEKARACQQLAVAGGPKSVPALAALLSDEKLSDYARSGLEAIDDPSVDAALRKALPELKGRLQAGVATSLGVRRDTAAVDALANLARDPKSVAADPALTSLGQIASKGAIDAILGVLAQGSDKLKLPAAHAALIGAEQLVKDGKTKEALALLDAVAKSELPAYVKEAAVNKAKALK